MPRPLQWFSSEIYLASLADATQSNLLLYSASYQAAALVKGATVTRTIVDMHMRANAVAQPIRLTYGITLVNADARAAGAFPDPEDMAETAGWLYRARMLGIHDSVSDGAQDQKKSADLRSQRILRNERDELHLIVHNGSGGGAILFWSAFIRVLIKLP